MATAATEIETTIPAEYHEASKRLRNAFQTYREYMEIIMQETRTMFNVLKEAGYTNAAAINKIAEDHKDLRGYSKRSIYERLPLEVKDQTKAFAGSHRKLLGVAKNKEFCNTNKVIDIAAETAHKIEKGEIILSIEHPSIELVSPDTNRIEESTLQTLAQDKDPIEESQSIAHEVIEEAPATQPEFVPEKVEQLTEIAKEEKERLPPTQDNNRLFIVIENLKRDNWDLRNEITSLRKELQELKAPRPMIITARAPPHDKVKQPRQWLLSK